MTNSTNNGKLTPVKVYDKLKADVIENISNGNLVPGTRLKGIKVLSHEYGISKNSVQNGLQELAKEGYLESKGVSGTYIRERCSPGTSGTKKTILMVYKNSPEKRYCSSQVKLGALEELTKYDFKQKIWNYDYSQGDRENQLSFQKTLEDNNIAGIILRRHNPFFLREIAEYPMVLCNSIMPPSYFVNSCEVRVAAPDMEIAYQATEHLINKGHSNIGLISHDRVNFNCNGYITALTDYLIELKKEWIIDNVPVDNNALLYEMIIKYLKENSDLTAVYVADDFVCSIVFDAITAMGKRVPDDISVISFSNKGNGPFRQQEVTRVEIDQYAVGEKSADLLIKLIHGKINPGFYCHIAAELVEGETVIKR